MKSALFFCHVMVVLLSLVTEVFPNIEETEQNIPDAVPTSIADYAIEETNATYAFETFKKKYEKIYHSDEEEKSRRAILEDNLKDIREHNAKYAQGLTTYKRGINQFSDMTLEEFSRTVNGYQPNGDGLPSARPRRYITPTSTTAPLPSTVDWRTRGYVTPVKNQSNCGSCWAFTATGVLEGQVFRKTGSLVSLSEQNLLDCSSSYGNQGCKGGSAGNTYNYIKANGGVDTEASYPYTAVQGNCRYRPQNVGARITGYIRLPSGDEGALKTAVAKIGPIAVAIDANHNSFKSYASGIYFEGSCTTPVNHAVLVVGYGTQNGYDFWIVKNSWGTGWGDKGYIYMSRNRNNQCLIASYGNYPTL